MDLTSSITPKSDQLNADDLMAGDITVTILEVKKGSAEQPFDFIVQEFPGRAYRPSKSMRRVMVFAWGPEASAYTGRRLTLHRNPDITFGPEKVGGIEIAAMSHIDKPVTLALTVKRGTRRGFTVQPIVARDWSAELELAGTDLTAIGSLGAAAKAAGAHAAVKQISARYTEVKANQ